MQSKGGKIGEPQAPCGGPVTTLCAQGAKLRRGCGGVLVFVRGRRFGREVPARWRWFPSVPPATTVAYYSSVLRTYDLSSWGEGAKVCMFFTKDWELKCSRE